MVRLHEKWHPLKCVVCSITHIFAYVGTRCFSITLPFYYAFGNTFHVYVILYSPCLLCKSCLFSMSLKNEDGFLNSSDIFHFFLFDSMTGPVFVNDTFWKTIFVFEYYQILPYKKILQELLCT
jgi:hypothetical protein